MNELCYISMGSCPKLRYTVFCCNSIDIFSPNDKSYRAAHSCNMEIFFSSFSFPIFHSPSAREILRKQKRIEKYFSYCTDWIKSFVIVHNLCKVSSHFYNLFFSMVYDTSDTLNVYIFFRRIVKNDWEITDFWICWKCV